MESKLVNYTLGASVLSGLCTLDDVDVPAGQAFRYVTNKPMYGIRPDEVARLTDFVNALKLCREQSLESTGSLDAELCKICNIKINPSTPLNLFVDFHNETQSMSSIVVPLDRALYYLDRLVMHNIYDNKAALLSVIAMDYILIPHGLILHLDSHEAAEYSSMFYAARKTFKVTELNEFVKNHVVDTHTGVFIDADVDDSIQGINLRSIYGVCLLTDASISMDMIYAWFSNTLMSNVRRKDIETLQRCCAAYKASLENLSAYKVSSAVEKLSLTYLGVSISDEDSVSERIHQGNFVDINRKSVMDAIDTYVASLIKHKPYESGLGALCVLMCNRMLIEKGSMFWIQDTNVEQYKKLFRKAKNTGDPTQLLDFIKDNIVPFSTIVNTYK